jgi:hypothetical protein
MQLGSRSEACRSPNSNARFRDLQLRFTQGQTGGRSRASRLWSTDSGISTSTVFIHFPQCGQHHWRNIRATRRKFALVRQIEAGHSNASVRARVDHQEVRRLRTHLARLGDVGGVAPDRSRKWTWRRMLRGETYFSTTEPPGFRARTFGHLPENQQRRSCSQANAFVPRVSPRTLRAGRSPLTARADSGATYPVAARVTSERPTAVRTNGPPSTNRPGGRSRCEVSTFGPGIV